jgi:hypothetical protein
MKRSFFEVSQGKFKIFALVLQLGRDFLVSIWGGTLPHIGAVGMAAPRPSLKDPKKWSATSSNFTFIGHKEDALVKPIAERLAAQCRGNVVVVAGIHWDGMTPKEIHVVERLTQKLSDEILRKIKSFKGRPAPGSSRHGRTGSAR